MQFYSARRYLGLLPRSQKTQRSKSAAGQTEDPTQNGIFSTVGIRRSGTSNDTSGNKSKRQESAANLSVAKSTRTIAILTGVLAGVAIVSAVISFFQWKEIHVGSADTHDLAVAAKRQATAAAQQAATMDRQLTVFKEQLDAVIYQQRPDIRILPAKPLFNPQLAKIVWNINFINVGKTDAVNLIVDRYMSVEEKDFEKSGPHGALISENFTSGIVNFISVISSDNFEISKAQEILTKDFGVRVLIEMSYFDNNGKRYFLSNCYGILATGAVNNMISGNCKKGAKDAAADKNP